jgi:hypothetical protein
MSKGETTLQPFDGRALKLFQLMVYIGGVELKPIRQHASSLAEGELTLHPCALLAR